MKNLIDLQKTMLHATTFYKGKKELFYWYSSVIWSFREISYLVEYQLKEHLIFTILKTVCFMNILSYLNLIFILTFEFARFVFILFFLLQLLHSFGQILMFVFYNVCILEISISASIILRSTHRNVSYRTNISKLNVFFVFVKCNDHTPFNNELFLLTNTFLTFFNAPKTEKGRTRKCCHLSPVISFLPCENVLLPLTNTYLKKN